jgi:hypothetical protein
MIGRRYASCFQLASAGTAEIQMNLRFSSEQREWLDAKVLALGAPSRSALVAEALRLHLTPMA